MKRRTRERETIEGLRSCDVGPHCTCTPEGSVVLFLETCTTGMNFLRTYSPRDKTLNVRGDVLRWLRNCSRVWQRLPVIWMFCSSLSKAPLKGAVLVTSTRPLAGKCVLLTCVRIFFPFAYCAWLDQSTWKPFPIRNSNPMPVTVENTQRAAGVLQEWLDKVDAISSSLL